MKRFLLVPFLLVFNGDVWLVSLFLTPDSKYKKHDEHLYHLFSRKQKKKPLNRLNNVLVFTSCCSTVASLSTHCPIILKLFFFA